MIDNVMHRLLRPASARNIETEKGQYNGNNWQYVFRLRIKWILSQKHRIDGVILKPKLCIKKQSYKGKYIQKTA